jgi:hypothetical protein
MARPNRPVFNLRKDPFDERDHLAAPASDFALPRAISLISQLGPVANQGGLGACTGEAGSGFLAWLYNAFTKYFPVQLHDPPQFSALFLYAEERIRNGTFPQDAGSDSRTLMQILNQIGTCIESRDPYSDQNGGVAPTEEMIKDAYPFRIGAYHRILCDAGMATAKSVLASGYCRVIGIPVYQAIQSDEVAETGMLPVPGPRESPVGGHEMLVYGFDDTIKIGLSLGADLVRNSWDIDWGIQGNLRIPYDYYAAVGGNDACDSWVGHLGRPWIPGRS